MSDVDFTQSTTPPLEEVMRAAVREGLLSVYTSMPGMIQDYDDEAETCSVQPALMRFYSTDSQPTRLPILNKVPVVFPRGGGFKMKWALKQNDVVQLQFSMRSIEIWKNQGGVVDPDDPRKFHISDAVAYPGGYPSNNPSGLSTAGPQTILQSGSAQVILLDSGKFKLTNGTNELFDTLSNICAQLITGFNDLGEDTTNTQIGPQALNKASAYTGIGSQLTALKAKIDSLKG